MSELIEPLARRGFLRVLKAGRSDDVPVRFLAATQHQWRAHDIVGRTRICGIAADPVEGARPLEVKRGHIRTTIVEDQRDSGRHVIRVQEPTP